MNVKDIMARFSDVVCADIRDGLLERALLVAKRVNPRVYAELGLLEHPPAGCYASSKEDLAGHVILCLLYQLEEFQRAEVKRRMESGVPPIPVLHVKDFLAKAERDE